MKNVHFICCAAAICLVAACRPQATTSLDVDLFETTFGQIPNPQLIDVRTPKEYAEGYIPGAILMDVKDANFALQIQLLDKSSPVFVYCRSGRRSLEAAAILEERQFTTVYNLEGGIVAWKEKGKALQLP
jgi:rhodanese-related sulfurtransferase